MFRLAGSRLPWKSFQASTCTSLVVFGLDDEAKLTETVSVREFAPEMVAAEELAGPPAASGASSTAPRLTATRPPWASLALGRLNFTKSLQRIHSRPHQDESPGLPGGAHSVGFAAIQGRDLVSKGLTLP